MPRLLQVAPDGGGRYIAVDRDGQIWRGEAKRSKPDGTEFIAWTPMRSEFPSDPRDVRVRRERLGALARDRHRVHAVRSLRRTDGGAGVQGGHRPAHDRDEEEHHPAKRVPQVEQSLHLSP